MFQAKKWSWKRVAANLLLVPVLTGGSVAVVHAQLGMSGSGSGSAATSGPQSSTPPNRITQSAAGDPKQLLADGRKALRDGRFADAQDLAQAAEHSNPSGKWGVFDDTPNALRKDIQAAKLKKNKADSEQLVKQAKATAAKPAATDGERAYNLDVAIQMARKAEQLHGGPYSVWEFGDHADKLVKEFQEARAKLKVASAAPPAAGGSTGRTPTGPTAAAGSGVAGRTPAAPPAGGPQAAGIDGRKQAALRLLAEGRALADQGNFVAARGKYAEADKLNAPFAPGEFSPGFAIQDLNAKGTVAIDRLIREAQASSGQKDFARADAALVQAAQVAATLGQFPKPVVEARQALYVTSQGRFGVAPPGGVAAAGGPEFLLNADPVGATAPGVPPGARTVYNSGGPVAPGGPVSPAGGSAAGAATGTAIGRQLLEQAEMNLKAGDYDAAGRIAMQAYNQGMKQEAALLLNTIDTEKFARGKRDAVRALGNARSAYQQKQYSVAYRTLGLIDTRLLSDEEKAEHQRVTAACKLEVEKLAPVVAAAAGGQPGDPPADPTPGANPPGTARVGPDAKPAPDGAAQADALRSVQFQKLRSEGLKVQTDAQAAFGRGETDAAMQMLMEYANRVRASGLDGATASRLLRPVEGRLEQFRLLKGQTDYYTKEKNEKRDAKERLAGRGAAEEDRKQEVAQLVRRYHELVKKNEYGQAEQVALQAKQLDPDDPAVGALAEMAKISRRRAEYDKISSGREDFNLKGLNEADRVGPYVSVDDPISVKLEAMRRARGRGSLDESYLRTRTQAEYAIEEKLGKLVSIPFTQTPLNEALKNIQAVAELPLLLDVRALEAAGISEVSPVTFDVGTQLAVKNVLSLILEPLGLSYVIEHDVVKVTTIKMAKGRLVTKVFSVADLVTPVPNFALPDYANFGTMLNRSMLNGGREPAGASTRAVFGPPGALGGGQTASTPLLPGTLATTPTLQPAAPGRGGTLQTDDPLAASASIAAGTTRHEQLIKLLTSMVRPYTWEAHGGSGKVEFFDIGSALVVNQTADVIQEIQDLLEALRRLQDLSVAVEIRIVSLSEAFFERMGVDFSLNILTNTKKFQPQLTNQTFTPVPFINSIQNVGTTVGLTPAGTFTPDLNVPIQNSSFNQAIPPFGGYPNTPGADGGISLGLAFLNDIQVYMFMELAQGDRRINVMQAPKVTLFNGQTASLQVNDLQFYVSNVTVTPAPQLVFTPNNVPLPIGVSITVQAVVSADRRFVRMSLPVTLTSNYSTNVPLIPFTTFITPIFEGGSQGQPVPFTQFLQQPGVTTVNVQTTVVCPDGGTVLLGGLKTLQEGRNEFGPPFLSKIPYLNRLFRNVGVGRNSTHVMIMVTPRIIINAEEEIFQTEGRPPGQ